MCKDINAIADCDDWQPPLVALVGMGTGRHDLSGRALQWIHRAEVLAGGKRLLDYFPEHPGQRIALQSPLSGSLDRLGRISNQHRTVVLASGDPFFFGIGRRLVDILGKERLLALPNVTTVQSLFARLAEPWEDVKVISLHGRGGSDGGEREWLRELRYHDKMAVFTDPRHNPAWIARQLMDFGASDRYLVVAEDLGLSTETVQCLSLEEAEVRTFSPLNIVAILPMKNSAAESVRRARPLLGLSEEAFQHQAGLITKMEVRAVVLAHLQLEPDLILWDLGAGSGSVSIEAARIAPLRQVIAVEKNAGRYEDLRQNVRRFGCAEVQTVHGNARDVLHRMPDPDRVFIGGSGADLKEMLDQVRHRLRPGGRVVQTVVMLDTLEAVRSFWREKPFDTSIIQLQINRSVPIGDSLRLESLNPVFVITACRSGGSSHSPEERQVRRSNRDNQQG